MARKRQLGCHLTASVGRRESLEKAPNGGKEDLAWGVVYQMPESGAAAKSGKNVLRPGSC